MKKRHKKVIAALMSISMVIPSVCITGQNFAVVYSASAEDEIVQGDMTFSPRINVKDELILDSYSGTASELVIPETVGGKPVTAIGSRVFAENKTIENVTLPDTISYFGSEVFRDSSLKSVNIPKALHAIPSYTFFKCEELENVEFHDDILIICNTAFKRTEVSLPDNLRQRVTGQTFSSSDAYCSFSTGDWSYTVSCKNSIVSMSIDEYTGSGSSEVIIPGDFCYADRLSCSYRALSSGGDIKRVVFPENIRVISINFANSPIEEVVLPATESIDDSAFENCTELKKVEFLEAPSSLDIGKQAFSGCTSLEHVPVPEGCEYVSIGNYAFESSGLKDAIINCKSDVGRYAFSKCDSLMTVSLSDSDVELNAFSKCNSLLTANLADSHLKSSVFMYCSNLKELTFSGKTTLDPLSIYTCDSLENINFIDCELESEYAFRKCPKLLNIDSVPAFDSETGDFTPEKKDFIYEHFIGSDEVGFINEFVLAQVDKVVRENITDDMSDVEKVRVLHDWVCANTKYTEGNERDRKNHNDASVFMNEATVCEGYTRACNLLYNAAGIETYYVLSDDHAWNIVKVGGQYFHVDATWDDLDTISHEWFLKSDDEMREAGGSHAQWKLYNASMLHSFQGKVLPECKYRMGDTNADGSVNIADLVLLQKYLLGNSGLDPDKRVLADVYSDGAIDGFDLTLLRENIINNMN